MSTISKRMKFHQSSTMILLDLDALPDEILIEILKYFDLKTRFRAMLTCRRWYRLLSDRRNSDLSSYVVTNLTLREHSHSDLFLSSYFPDGHNKLENLKYLLKHFGRCDSLEMKPKSSEFVRKLTDIFYGVDENRNSTAIDDESSSKTDDVDVNDDGESILDTDTILIRNVHLESLVLDELPEFVRHFYLHALYFPNRSFVRWPDAFAQMRTLCLRGFPIPSNCRFPPNLSVLKYNCEFQSGNLRSCLNQLTTCPNLELLEIGSVVFDDATFRNLIHTIRDHLLKLECLTFNEAIFPSSSILRESIRDSTGCTDTSMNWFENLREINFGPVNGSYDFYSMVEQFLLNFRLRSIFVDAKINDLNHVYRLIPALVANGTELRVRLGFPTYDSESNEFRSSAVLESPPPEFGRTLTHFRAHEISNIYLVRSIFRCGNFEHLIEWEFVRCEGLEDENVVFISKYCPRLERLSIRNCWKVNPFAIAQFVVNWQSIQSRRVVVEFIGERRDLPATALELMSPQASSSQNTSITLGKVASEAGIVFETGQDRYDFGDGRRASMIDKDLPSGRKAQRLIVWEQEDSTKGGDGEMVVGRPKKVLIVRSYGEEELGLNVEFGIDMD